MLQAVRDWFNSVPDKWSIMTRLSKNSVRMHENVRLSGEGGTNKTEGTFAQGQAHQFQQSLGQKIPLFGTALNLAQGNTKELPGFPPPAPFPALPALPPLPPLPPAPTLDFPGHGFPPQFPPSATSYAPPPGPPPTSYAPPPGPPPQQSHYHAPNHSGYAPSYEPATYGQPPNFGGGYGTSSPTQESHAFPGMQGFAPPGPPPSFPQYDGPPQQQQYPHHHQQQQQYPHHGQSYGGGW